MPNLDATYVSVAETFGFVHHEGTDPALELEVLKCILVREGLVSKLRDLVKKINAQSHLDSVPKIYSRRVHGSSSFKKDIKRQVLIVLTECRKVTAKLTSCILKWRQSSELLPPRPFIWRSENYLLRVRRDLNFLAECSVLVKALKIPKERMMDNPLMLPNNLDGAISPEFWFDEPNRSTIPITEDDANIEDEQKKKERLILRKAEAVLLIERKYEEMKNSGNHLANNFLKRAIEIISPPKEPSIALYKSLETKHPNLKINSGAHFTWQRNAKKQLAALEKGELTPRNLLIPKRGESGRGSEDEKKRSRTASIPKEVICFHGFISTDFDESTYSHGLLSEMSIFGEKSFSAQEKLLKNNFTTPSVLSHEKKSKKYDASIDTSIAIKRRLKYQKMKSQLPYSSGPSKHHNCSNGAYRRQTKLIHRSSLHKEYKTPLTNKNLTGNIIDPCTEELIVCFRPEDQMEIISLNKPSSSEMWVAEIIHTLLCPGQYAPTNLSWERFQSRVREKEFVQTLNSFDSSNIKGPKMKALQCLFQNQACANDLSITPAVAKLAAWASKILNSALPNNLELMESLRNLSSFLHKDQLRLNEKKCTSISDSRDGKSLKTVSLNSSHKKIRQKFLSQPLAVGKEKGKLLCSCQHIISNRNMFVSCFSTKTRYVSVKVYDASSSEEFRNIFKIPSYLKTNESIKIWTYNSLLDGLRLDSKNRKFRKLVLLPSAYEFKSDILTETQKTETPQSKRNDFINEFTRLNVEISDQKKNIIVNEQKHLSKPVTEEKSQGQPKESNSSYKLHMQCKGENAENNTNDSICHHNVIHKSPGTTDNLSSSNITEELKQKESPNEQDCKIRSIKKSKTSCDYYTVDDSTQSNKSDEEISSNKSKHSENFAKMTERLEGKNNSEEDSQNYKKRHVSDEDVESNDTYYDSDINSYEENSFCRQNESHLNINNVNEKNEVEGFDTNVATNIDIDRCGDNAEKISEVHEVNLKHTGQTLNIDHGLCDKEINPHDDVICDHKENTPQNKLIETKVNVFASEQGHHDVGKNVVKTNLDDSQIRISNKYEINNVQECHSVTCNDKTCSQNTINLEDDSGNKTSALNDESLESYHEKNEKTEIIGELKSMLLHDPANETKLESLVSEEDYSDDTYTDYSNFEDDSV